LKSDEPRIVFSELNKVFSVHGPLVSIKLHIDNQNLTKEYAYIQFYKKEDADVALKELHHQ